MGTLSIVSMIHELQKKKKIKTTQWNHSNEFSKYGIGMDNAIKYHLTIFFYEIHLFVQIFTSHSKLNG